MQTQPPLPHGHGSNVVSNSMTDHPDRFSGSISLSQGEYWDGTLSKIPADIFPTLYLAYPGLR